MTKDYTEDYESARDTIAEEGTIAVMSWKSAVATDSVSGVQTGGVNQSAQVAIVHFPASSRGDTYEMQVQVRNTRRSFIATPMVKGIEILNGRFVTIGAVKYEIEASAGLAPSGDVKIIYQGMLRIAG